MLLVRVLIAALVSLTFIGFLTSTFYGSPLGLSMDFEGEFPFVWPVWGLRALILPFGQIVFAIGIAAAASLLWRIALVLGPLRSWRTSISAASGRLAGRLHSISAVSIASGLLTAQVIVLWLFWRRFEALFYSMNSFFVRSGSLGALGPGYSDEHQWYVRSLAMIVLVFGWSWFRLVRLRVQTGDSSGPMIWTAGVLTMIITLLLMVAPYRLFFHSVGERVSYQSDSCYVVGRKGNEALLFCPLKTPPWSRLVNLSDPALTRSGVTAAIFPAQSGE
jgi:hypothetical protein